MGEIDNMFWEIHRDIPREGPGDDKSTRKALQMLTNIPIQANVLDVGCGPGMQTIELARNLDGKIVALDNHQSFLDVLNRSAEENGMINKITPVNGSMFSMDFEQHSFDLIWAEGSVYIIGFERGLKEWSKYLKQSGFIVVTEISWLKKDIPEEPKTFWETNYPEMQSISRNIKTIEDLGFRPIGHFILPESSWWENYYFPLEKRICSLRQQYKDGDRANKELDEAQYEINLYRRYSQYYGYVFYLMQK